MNLLILKGFNNYFNRKVKKYSNLEEYMANSSSYYNFGDINFVPNDGVVTEQIVGSENQQEIGGSEPEPLKWEIEGSPDYLIAYSKETIDETEVVTIHSRWFVMESVRVRDGQYKLALKRDVFADYLKQILRADCFVEKGYVAPENPLIFNEEGVSLNQIKKGETMLTDETGIPWLVLYVAKNFPASDTPGIDANGNLPIEGQMTLDTSSVVDYDDLPWSNLETPPGTGIDTSFKRYIKSAGEISMDPIFGSKVNITGSGEADQAMNEGVRLSIKCYHNPTTNVWAVDRNSTKTQRIEGRLINVIDIVQPWLFHPFHLITREAIGLTPADRIMYWNTPSGSRILSYAKPRTTLYQTGGVDWQKAFNAASVIYNKFIDNSSALDTYITGYLNSKYTSLRANTTYTTTDRGREYYGGNQMFLPAVNILYYNNRIVKAGVNYYRVKVNRKEYVKTKIDYFEPDGSGYPQPSSTNSLMSHIAKANELQYDFTQNEDNEMVETSVDSAWFEISYERIAGDLLRFTLPKPATRVQLNDAAYDMICFPYGEIKVMIPNDDNQSDILFTSTKEASIGMARSIAAQIGSALYDIQLLPYCPYRELAEKYKEDGYIDLGITSPFPYACWSGVYKINTAGDTPLRINARSAGIWCYSSHGSFDIEYEMEMPEHIDGVEYKVFNACKKFRLVSPNYTSVFEFNPLKNNGVDRFNVDFNYRPYNPYIHIAPFFKDSGLYGVDTNDSRGLILQGDFSVGYYSDKWADYQINNANYANIFNRQMQNLDSMQKLEREQTWTNAGINIASEFLGLGGGLRGATAGGSAGGPWGALIGGIAGTVTGGAASAVGAHLDKRWMNWAQNEQRSFATDMYNYNIGTVKALPYGLAKSDALNENFKFFPFIERYECTDIESRAFRTKLYYDGMTVGIIDALEDFLPPDNDQWFRLCGRMIRLESLVDDFQIANEIFTEVQKGFYYHSSYVNEGE